MTRQFLTLTKGQTRFGLFTNLYPTRICRQDRDTLHVWYVDVHLWPFFVSFMGTIR